MEHSSSSFLNDIENEYLTENSLPIVYRKEYNISFYGLEKLHPFDSKKYGRVYEFLIKDGIVTRDQIVSPNIISDEDLESIHTEEYLKLLKNKKDIAGILEIPILYIIPYFLIQRLVLNPMKYQTGGTVLASYLSLIKGWAINIGGGFHHACSYCGGGFCVYADISLSILKLRNAQLVKKVMIIDLDAHQGNGHEREFIDDENTFIIDAFNPGIYPQDYTALKAIDKPIHVYKETTDKEYLKKVKTATKESILKFNPDFIVYNAGTDCLEGDPLGDLSITAEGIVKRDHMIFKLALTHSIPIVMVLSGGYQMNNARIIADSITNIMSYIRKTTE